MHDLVFCALNLPTFNYKISLLFTRTFFVIFFTAISVTVKAQLKRYTFTESKMGSPFMLVMYCNDSVQAAELAGKSYKLIDSFINIFSDYINSSELMQLTATAGVNIVPVKVSPALLEILILSKKAFSESSGSFDITIGPQVKLWRSARKTKQLPDKEKIAAAKNSTGFNYLIIDSVEKTAILTKQGMSLDLGGIAKGWIAQKIIDFLHTEGVANALADAGGDIVMSAAPPGTQGWIIGVNIPERQEELLNQSLLLQNKSVATSGDAYQYVEKNGIRYSHIVDPQTGYGVTFQRNVTVIANDGATADWLATACSILPIKKAKKLAIKMGAELLISANKNDKIVFYSTKGFNQYWKQRVL